MFKTFYSASDWLNDPFFLYLSLFWIQSNFQGMQKKQNMLNRKALQGANDCNACISFSLGQNSLSDKQRQSTHRKAHLEPAISDAQNVFPTWKFHMIMSSYMYDYSQIVLHLVQLPLQIITISCPLSHLSNSIFWCIIKEQTALWLANLDLTWGLFPDEGKSELKEAYSNIQQCSCGVLLRYFIVSAYHKNIVK